MSLGASSGPSEGTGVKPRWRMVLSRTLWLRDHSMFVVVLFALLSVTAGGFSLLELRKASAEARQLYDNLLGGLDLISGLQFDVQEARRRMLYALTTRNANLQVQYADESRAADARVRTRITGQLSRVTRPADLVVARRFIRDWTSYLQVRDEVIALILEGQTEPAIALDLRDGTAAFDHVRRDLRAMQARFEADAEGQRLGVEQASNRSFDTIIAILLLSQLLAVFGLRKVWRGEALERERRSQARLLEVVESIDEGMLVFDRAGRVLLWNAAAQRLTGRSRSQVLGLTVHRAWPELAHTALLAGLENTGGPAMSPARETVRLGERVLDVKRFPFDEGASIFFRDVTDLERRTDDLERTASLLAATLESTADGILAVDLDRRITLFNQRLLELWRIPSERIAVGLHERVLHFVREQVLDDAEYVAKVRMLYASPDLESLDDIEFKDGRIFERFSVPQYINGKTVGRVWSFRDATLRRAAEQKLVHGAFHDALTMLPNRSRFTELLSRSLRRASLDTRYAFATLFLDIDRFKIVNDSLGHAMGDQLLVAVARRLELCVRPGDTVARLGGDEFTVLIDNVQTADDAIVVANRIMRELERPFELGTQHVVISASLGIALSSTGYGRPEDLLRDADLAMYRAKANGKSRYEVFDQAMHAKAVTRLRVETDLRRAVDRSDFKLHYQPIVSLRTERIVGVEALVRWAHPARGLIAPYDFLEVAEETGLITPLGYWVLNQACRQLARWRRTDPSLNDLSVSVNLSARQFVQPDLVGEVTRALQAHHLPPGSLRLEFTESVLIAHEGPVHGTLAALRALGVQLDLDDFGTGYSSLSHLHRFEMDGLKIDRSFVQNIRDDGEGSAIARTIVSLARNLELSVIAEGVETLGQLMVLKELQCDLVQGYLFARPLPADAMTRMLIEGVDAVWSHSRPTDAAAREADYL